MADKTSAARAERDDRVAGGRRGNAASKAHAAAPASEISATQLDRLIHERTRLAIVSALAVNPSLSFTELKQLLGASDGNLSVHARKLEGCGPHRLHEIIFRSSSKNRVPPDGKRPARSRALSGSHGSTDSRDPRGLRKEIFLTIHFAPESTLMQTGAPGLHVAIVMDGNGRWAAARGLLRSEGHRAGVDAVRRVVAAAPELGVGTLTVFALSSDNWRRPGPEIAALLALFEEYLLHESRACAEHGVQIRVIGRRDRIPPSLASAIQFARTGNGFRAND
jgi:hypothetical protein